MESVKTIKGIDEETWFEFKSMASKNNLKMPEMFKLVVSSWKSRSSNTWEKILNSERILSEKDAKSLLKTSAELRSESDYR